MFSIILASFGFFPLPDVGGRYEACEAVLSAPYYAYNRCFNDDVMIGARWDGSQILLTCARVRVICPLRKSA
jgi:hypothetical protein